MVEANGEFAFSKVSILTGKGKWGMGLKFRVLEFGVWMASRCLLSAPNRSANPSTFTPSHSPFRRIAQYQLPAIDETLQSVGRSRVKFGKTRLNS